MHSTDPATARAVPRPRAGDQFLLMYMRWLPLLWLGGAYVLAMLALVLRLAWRRWPTQPAINILFLLWALVAATQAASVLWNWALAGQAIGRLPGALFSITVIGWFFLGLGLAVGHAHDLANRTGVRAVMVLGLWIVLFGVLGHAVALTTGRDDLIVVTPLRMLAGQSHAADFYTLAMFFKMETGARRFILFFPWPTALALGGICLLCIATCERDRVWRAIGIGGGLFGVMFSYSRAGYVALLVALCVLVALRMRPFLALAALALAALAGLGMIIANIGPLGLVEQALAKLQQARPGSSMARTLIYEESWRAFLNAPVLGHGWVGPSVHPVEELPIGSHSTFYGVLYTGGLVTFGALALATVGTVGACVTRGLSSRDPRAIAASAITVAIIVFAYGESLYSLVLPLMFVFLFIGGSLRAPFDPLEHRA